MASAPGPNFGGDRKDEMVRSKIQGRKPNLTHPPPGTTRDPPFLVNFLSYVSSCVGLVNVVDVSGEVARFEVVQRFLLMDLL